MVLDGLAVFEFGVICEVFGIDRSADGVPNFDFKVCGPVAGCARPDVGRRVGSPPTTTSVHLIGADLVAVPAISGRSERLPRRTPSRRLADGPRVAAGSIILTVCSGAFVVGAAGLLDGRPCTTHWMHADELARVPDRAWSTATCCTSTTVT